MLRQTGFLEVTINSLLSCHVRSFFCQVVLPTFILERRSLLEMYADFFAHPDLFVK